MQQSGHGHNQNALGHLRQLEECAQALRYDVLVRRKAIVRQGFPVGEAQYRQGRRKEAKFLLQTIAGRGVGGDDQAESLMLEGGLGDCQRACGTVQPGPVHLVSGAFGERKRQ